MMLCGVPCCCPCYVAGLQALQLNPSKGAYKLHSNLSATYLQLGDKQKALQHAQQAVATAPKNFHMVRNTQVVLLPSYLWVAGVWSWLISCILIAIVVGRQAATASGHLVVEWQSKLGLCDNCHNPARTAPTVLHGNLLSTARDAACFRQVLLLPLLCDAGLHPPY